LEKEDPCSRTDGDATGQGPGTPPSTPEPTPTPEVPFEPPASPIPGQRPDRAEGKEKRDGDRADAVRQFGTLRLPKASSRIHCLSIIGQIEGHLVLPSQNKTTKYEHLIPQLVAIEQNPEIEGLVVILNTVGGDVEAGLAIAEMISSLSKPKVALVLGGGHSIGVPIAVACDRSIIASTATMTIHPIRLSGLVIGVPQTYEYLDKMQDRVVKFVIAHSRIDEAGYRDLMFRTGELARDIGTVLVGGDAVEAGLMDDVGGLSDAVKALEEMIEQRKREQGRRPRRRGRARRARAARRGGGGRSERSTREADSRRGEPPADGEGEQGPSAMLALLEEPLDDGGERS